MFSHGASAYRKMQVTTANPAQLVVQLYEGSVCFIERAVQALERRDLEVAHNNLVRAQAIITELRATLKRDVGPMAQQLDGLYDYVYRELVDANVRKDPEPALGVLRLLRDLLGAWRVVASEAQTFPALVDGTTRDRVPVGSRR